MGFFDEVEILDGSLLDLGFDINNVGIVFQTKDIDWESREYGEQDFFLIVRARLYKIDKVTKELKLCCMSEYMQIYTHINKVDESEEWLEYCLKLEKGLVVSVKKWSS